MTRSGGSTGAVGVTFATSNGTATAGSDYTAVTQTVNFANGDMANKTVNIPIINDTTVEAKRDSQSNPEQSHRRGNAWQSRAPRC